MEIAILGAGAIGSLFAYRFARAGHAVTLVARGARLAELRRDARVRVRRLPGQQTDEAAVAVADTLDPARRWDLVLVTVRGQQADAALIAQLRASSARQLMFMFNTARDLTALRDSLGRERVLWGFPAAIARLGDDGVLAYSIVPAALRFAQITTLGGLADYLPPGLPAMKTLFVEAGFPVAVCADMSAWLKTHAAFMMPLMAAGLLASGRGGLRWREARLLAAAMREGFALVRSAHLRVTPANMALLGRVPGRLIAGVLWLAFRLARVRASLAGGHARGEASAVLAELRQLGPPAGSEHLTELATAITTGPAQYTG